VTPTSRQWAAGITALVVLLGLAFSAGRFTAPVKTDVREVEKVVWKDRVVEKVVTRKAKAVDRVVYVDRVVTPEGEVREKRTTRTLTDARELVDLGKASESAGSSASSSTSATTLRPDWRVGVLAGASLTEPLVPIAGPLVLGASVERRIVGGLSAGAWVNTVGAAGASVSMEF
jgi:hypothetical protein